MAKNITVELSATNIGPHENLNSKLTVGSIEMGIYANNGSGKTFLSRAFRLCTKATLQSTDSDKLLTLGKSTGNFKLKITNSQEPGITRDLEFSISRNNVPEIVKNTTGYLFRVFNEDYIKENLEGFKYKPSGEIEGYILGKEKIDLSNEKIDLTEKIDKRKELEDAIKLKIASALAVLDDLSIRKNTGDYQNINFANLVNSEYEVEESDAFQTILAQHNQLKALPDNLEDLKNVSYIRKTRTTTDVSDFLEKEFTRSSIAEEFKQTIKAKQDFIELGVKLLKDDQSTCPFCEQQLEGETLNLIDLYNEYLSESEAQQIKYANDLRAQLYSDRKEYSEIHKGSALLEIEYLKNQKFIPSLHDQNLLELENISSLDQSYKVLIDALEEKKKNIAESISSDEIREAIINIESWVETSNQKIERNSFVIKSFNDKKNNTNAEKLALNRRLCKAKFLELKSCEKDSIDEIEKLSKEINVLEEDIIQKEQNEKVSKKQKVVETFTSLLTRFFGNKYSFDDQTFCLKFRNHLLESNASDVLSTGEKSIVAFCYYIAESHTIVDQEEDYKKLFFIIDDPISSQDFHFVYATAQIIRTLNKLFDIPRLRLILLTHNLEFMSIMIRNKIIDQKYIFVNEKIVPLSNELIMPYEEHLRDVYSISQGSKQPTHTTPNSLRHILETINRFIAPDIDLADFCDRIEGFSENEFLYSLMHDGSHGGIRLQKAYTDGMIKSACDVVSNYVLKDFEGQIKIISN